MVTTGVKERLGVEPEVLWRVQALVREMAEANDECVPPVYVAESLGCRLDEAYTCLLDLCMDHRLIPVFQVCCVNGHDDRPWLLSLLNFDGGLVEKHESLSVHCSGCGSTVLVDPNNIFMTFRFNPEYLAFAQDKKSSSLRHRMLRRAGLVK